MFVVNCDSCTVSSVSIIPDFVLESNFSGNNVIKAKSNLAFQINANGGSDIGDHSVNFAIILDYDTPV